MDLRAKIKSNARKALGDFWGQSIAITLMVLASALILLISESLLLTLMKLPAYLDVNITPENPFDDLPDTSPLSFLLLFGGWFIAFITTTPLFHGMRRWFYIRGLGEYPEFVDIFYFYSSIKSYFKSLWVQLNLSLRSFFWSALYLLPGFTCLVLGGIAKNAQDLDSDGILSGGLFFSGAVITLSGAIFLTIHLQRLTLAKYLFYDDESVKISAAIRVSASITRKQRVQMLVFRLSFAGWFVLCLAGIPIIYVLPFYRMSGSIYARFLIEQGNAAAHYDALLEGERFKLTEKRVFERRQSS